MKKIFYYFLAAFTILITELIIYSNVPIKILPVVAIASYSSHPSFNCILDGFKDQMKFTGFKENHNIIYEIEDVGLDTSLIPQIINNLKTKKPKLIAVMTEPVAQVAKDIVEDIPVIYVAVTDPIKAGLIQDKNKSYRNLTGSSDMEDIEAFLNFVKAILPPAKTVGVLYDINEVEDIELVNKMNKGSEKKDMSVVAISLDHSQDLKIKMQEFKNKVDLIYITSSDATQGKLSVISAEASKMHIPIFNTDAQSVRNGLAFASFGVSCRAVGRNAGKLAAEFLHGQLIKNLRPLYPEQRDHRGVINKKLAAEFGIAKISRMPNVEIVE